MSGIQLRIGADTSDLERGLSQSQAMLRDNARQMQRNIGVAAKYTAAIVAAGAALSVHLVRQTMNAIDEQSKLARSLGASVDALTALQIAGERAGISQGSLNAALATYTARLGEARRGTGQGVVAFDRLGLSAEELAAIPLDEQMQLIGERVRGLGLDASETADLLRNLGIRNREMIGFIREGTADLENARDIMNQFGLAINDVDAQRIEAANDALAKIGMTARGLRQIIAVELAGPLEEVAETISTMFGDMSEDLHEGVREAVRISLRHLANFLDGAANIADFVNQNPMMAQFGLLGFVVFGPKGAAIGGIIGAIFEKISREAAKFGIGISETEHTLNQIVDIEAAIERRTQAIAEVQDDINRRKQEGQRVTDHEIEALDGMFERLGTLVNRRDELVDSLGEEVDLQAEINRHLEEQADTGTIVSNLMRATAEATRNAADNLGRLTDEYKELKDETDDGEGEPDPVIPIALKLSEEERQALEDRLQLLRDSRQDELESLLAYLKEKEKAILADIENEVENAEELEKLLLQVREEGRLARKQQDEREAADRLAITKGMLNNLSTLMNTGSRELFAIGKAAAISNALVSAQEAVTHAFARGNQVGGPPLGFAFAGTAAAASAVQISSLASQQFGTGSGTPSTGAGAGGGAGIPQAAAQTAGREQTLLVQGDFTQDQLFTGSTVRKLIESIAEQQRDGFTVVI